MPRISSSPVPGEGSLRSVASSISRRSADMLRPCRSACAFRASYCQSSSIICVRCTLTSYIMCSTGSSQVPPHRAKAPAKQISGKFRFQHTQLTLGAGYARARLEIASSKASGDDHCIAGDLTERIHPLGVRQNAAAGAAVKCIAPQRLHRNAGTVGERDVGGRTLARGDPGALIADLRPVRVRPARARELVGHGLRHLMPRDDSNAGRGTEAVEVRPATRARIGDVREVRVSQIAILRAGRAVVGAELRPKAIGVVVRGGGNDVLHAGIATPRRVAKVRRRPHGLGGELRLTRPAWSCGGIVVPDPGEYAVGIASWRAGTVAIYRAGRHVLTVLSDGV